MVNDYPGTDNLPIRDRAVKIPNRLQACRKELSTVTTTEPYDFDILVTKPASIDYAIANIVLRHLQLTLVSTFMVYDILHFDLLPTVPPGEEAFYGGSVSLADYCPYLQEFTWKHKSVLVRGSRCSYEENTPIYFNFHTMACCVVGCNSNKENSNTALYPFPLEYELCALWARYCVGADWWPDSNDRVCYKHFDNPPPTLSDLPTNNTPGLKPIWPLMGSNTSKEDESEMARLATYMMHNKYDFETFKVRSIIFLMQIDEISFSSKMGLITVGEQLSFLKNTFLPGSVLMDK
ncbi:hypothetical protein evm_014539 [Chilo suppressalis]|nr:hypothetical protein evm_014539 [Chilo suppressalis]